jgi:Tol biopolymer transport system component
MDSVNAQPILGTESPLGGQAAWSPDARSIVYVSENKLLRLEMNGGSPQTLTSAPANTIGAPAWSPAGIILFRSSADLQLYQIPASGGESKPAMSSTASQTYPSFLPDGRSFLYIGGAISGLYTGALDSKEGKRLAVGSSGVFIPPEWLLNVRGSTLVAQSLDAGKLVFSGDPIPIADQVAIIATNGGGFSVSRNGVLAYRRALPPQPTNLTWYDRQGKRLATVGEQAVYTNPALSPDGKRLAVGRLDPSLNARDIWVLDLARGASSRFTFDKADETNPVWSPDGSRIAYSLVRKDSPGIRDIYWKAAGGAGAEELLLQDAGNNAMEDWSPDGKLLLFNVGTTEIDALPVSGDRKRYPVLKASFRQNNGCLSPDGRWIAYVSEESGKADVFVQNFPPAGGKWQISNGGGNEPSWRRDGKELYFLNGTKLEAVAVNGSGSSFEMGIPKDLFDAPVVVGGTLRRNRYVAASDGQRFLVVTAPKSVDTAPFVVVQNWQSALKH